MLKIRQYMPADCDKLMKLFYTTVHTVNTIHYTKEQCNAWATGNEDRMLWNKSFLEHASYVLEKDKQIVGFADVDDTGYLDKLYVHKDYQRQGNATALLNALEQYVRSSGIPFVVTHASITAKPFFEKRGYVVICKNKVICHGVELINYTMKKEMNL